MSKQTSMMSFFTKKATPAKVTPKHGADAVGRGISVFWPADDAWYRGVITKFGGGTHTVRYDDGDVEDVDLSVEKYEFVGAAAEAPRIFEDPPSPAAAAAPAEAARPALTAEQRARAERNKLEAARRRESKELKDKPEGPPAPATKRKSAGSDDDSSLECVPPTKTPSSKKARRTIVDDDDEDASLECAPATKTPSSKTVRRTIHDDDDEVAASAVITGSTRKRRADDGGRASAAADNPVTPRVAAGRDSLSSRFARGSQPSVAPSSATARRRESALSLPDDDDAGGSVEKGASGVYACGAHVHDTEPAYAFLSDAAQRRDASGRPRDHAAFDQRTMTLTSEWERLKLTEVQQQWWRLKASFADCVLFFKIGKFYELYHTDSDTAVREAGLVYMKGAQAHSGFPEISYGKYVEALVAKGYKVARVEQTETPEGSKARIARHKEDHKAGKRKAPTKADQAMRREVCSLTTPGTRMYTVLDMRTDKEGGGFEPVRGATLLVAVKQVACAADGGAKRFSYGVCVVDAPTGAFTLAQFDDDAQRTRLRTMLASFPPGEVLLERGAGGGELRALLERATSARVESLAPDSEFWRADATVKHLDACGAFPRASKAGGGDAAARAARWPRVLRDAVVGDAQLALAALGGAVWWLKRGLVDVELLSMRRFDAYVPADAEDGALTAQADEDDHFVPYDEAGLSAALRLLDASDDECDDVAPDRRCAPRLALDATTLKNLEVLKSSAVDQRKGSVWSLFDQVVVTPFGSRLLRAWLAQPLLDSRDIMARTDAVAELVERRAQADALRQKLKRMPDLERLLQQLHTLGAARRAAQLDDDALRQHPDARAVLFEAAKFNARKVQQLVDAIRGLQKIDALFRDAAEEDAFECSLLKKCAALPELGPQLSAFDEGFDLEAAKRTGELEAREGSDDAYDAARNDVADRRQALDDWLKAQKKALRCADLEFMGGRDRYLVKVPESFFGRASVPQEWEQKKKTKASRSFEACEAQDLLRELEAAERRVGGAKLDQLRSLFAAFDASRARWAAAVACVAALDALLALAHVSRREGFCRARVVDGAESFIEIRGGAHPCLEAFGGDVICNDVTVGGSAADMLLLSGPNMGGKSTLLRHVCVSALLAQCGCFVRAVSCRLTPVDRIFTRLGASDRILEGQSTFYVEMLETATILKSATSKSLVILDELGRGTATFDGNAIAHAVVDHLVSKTKCRTLFATHYHDLVESWAADKRVQLGHMDCVVQPAGRIVFLYTLVQGVSPRSFGINVARLARLPQAVLDRAAGKSAEFEADLRAKQSSRRA